MNCFFILYLVVASPGKDHHLQAGVVNAKNSTQIPTSTYVQDVDHLTHPEYQFPWVLSVFSLPVVQDNLAAVVLANWIIAMQEYFV